jgi:acyl-CoA synthetase (AMP-forming)/AMP-acid ligase II
MASSLRRAASYSIRCARGAGKDDTSCADWVFVTISVNFADGFEAFGDQPALIVHDDVITYRQLDGLVSDARAEVGPGRRLVVISMRNALEPLVSYLGALRARCPVIVVDGHDRGQLAAAIERYDPDIVMSNTARGWSLTEVRATSAHELHPDLALLLSTSGSTTTPKLVRLSADNLSSNATSIAEYLDINSTDRAITTLPLNYCYGLSVVHSHLLRGASLVLSTDSVLDQSFWHDVDRWQVSSFAGVPHTFDLLDRIDFAHQRHPSLRTITQAGGRLAPDRVLHFANLAARDGWRLFVMYGQTEATARMSYVPPDQLRSFPETIGIPIPGGDLRVEPIDNPARIADAGELVYRGRNVMLGYANGPDDLALGRTVDELRTGDLARQLPNGMFEIVGRASRFVKLFGRRVDLDQVERDLKPYGVEARCAGSDSRLVVAVRSIQDAETAQRFMVDALGLSASVVCVCRFDDFPRLTNGKVDYTAIARAGALASPRTGPPRRRRFGGRSAPLTVTEAFSIVFDRSDISTSDSFVGLGGDSMSYIEASVYVEQALGYLPENWHTMSVSALEQHVRPRSRLHSVETNVVLRAVAILLVAGSHLNVFRIEGSAHVLLAVAGFNFARFQLATVAKNDSARGILASTGRIVVPTLIWSGVLLAVDSTFYPVSFLLITNFIGQPAHGFRTDFWFVEAVVQIMLVLFVVFTIPAMRSFQRVHPLRLAAAALAVGLLARYGLGALWDPTYRGLPKVTHIVLWLFTLGWATAAVTTARHRLMLTAVVVLAMPGFFDYAQRGIIAATGLLVLIWIPRLPVLWPLNRLAAVIANATLYIYLIHVTVAASVEFPSPIVAWASTVALGIAIGLVAERVMKVGESWLRARWHARNGRSPVAATR